MHWRSIPHRFSSLFSKGAASLGVGLFLFGCSNPPTPTYSIEAMVDSQFVHHQAAQWAKCLEWSQRIVEVQPDDAMSHLNVAAMWNNLSWLNSRGSLEKVERQKRSLAAIDQAIEKSSSLQEWVLAKHYQGQIYETQGLPIDALEAYREVLDLAPDYAPTLGRYNYVLDQIQN